jgi:hypothetical protein
VSRDALVTRLGQMVEGSEEEEEKCALGGWISCKAARKRSIVF